MLKNSSQDAGEALQVSPVEMMWDFFKAERRWPTRKEFLLQATDAGLSLSAVLRSPDLSLRSGSGEDARPTFLALVRLPEVRQLLEPLPEVLRQAADVFARSALTVADNHLPTLHYRDVKKHWADAARARMAFDVLRSTGPGFLHAGGGSNTDPDDFHFSLSIDSLRYEHVGDLEDVLRLPRYASATDAGRYPSGKHLELLRRIFGTSRLDLRWPRALSFALATRDVGYVPQLVAELRPRFIRTEFRASQHSSLVLTLDALPWVDPSGGTAELLIRAIATVVNLWRRSGDKAEVTIAQLARVLGVPAALLAPTMAFLESSTWCQLSHQTDDHLGLVIVPGDPELVLRNVGITTFDEYMNAWDIDEPDALSEGLLERPNRPSTTDDKEEPTIPSLAVEFLKSDSYRRVLEHDLEELGRTLAARAWKSSLILLGGLLEGVLLDVLSRRADLTESVMGRKKTLSNASLVDLIEAALELRIVQPSVVPFAGVAKDFRDLVHPFRSSVSPLRPTEVAVKAMLHALSLVVEDLDAAFRDGRITTFEMS